MKIMGSTIKIKITHKARPRIKIITQVMYHNVFNCSSGLNIMSNPYYILFLVIKTDKKRKVIP